MLKKVYHVFINSIEITPIFGKSEFELILASYMQLSSYCITQPEYEAIKQCCITGVPAEIVDASYLHIFVKLVALSSSVFSRELLLQDLLICVSNEKKKSNMK